jgi:hypothetical protein
MTAARAVVAATVEIAAVVDVEMIVAIVAVGETKPEAAVVAVAAVAVANGMTRSVAIVAVLANPTEAAVAVAVAPEVVVAVVSVQMMEIQKPAKAAVGKMTEAVVMIGAIVTTAEMPKAILRTRMVEIVAVAAEVVAVVGHVSTKARATVVTSKAADKAVIDGSSFSKSELQPAPPPL